MRGDICKTIAEVMEGRDLRIAGKKFLVFEWLHRMRTALPHAGWHALKRTGRPYKLLVADMRDGRVLEVYQVFYSRSYVQGTQLDPSSVVDVVEEAVRAALEFEDTESAEQWYVDFMWEYMEFEEAQREYERWGRYAASLREFIGEDNYHKLVDIADVGPAFWTREPIDPEGHRKLVDTALIGPDEEVSW